ncbi:MAG TPA: 3'-5' exonuclease [Actinophytocola sp.]|uniref:3'-5' exonuclease n=1 Tax=Actinophytocola sp. TaxID=1872138 RepID=UPI002DB59990|nr:3'-5' exonuclease [Actinophytocola sp.]HEU5469138.1 3'-5' exonuclease [Actinophytocola sp.]
MVRPENPISRFATRVHGLSNDDVTACPVFEDVSAQVMAALDADAVVAHHAQVDLAVLRRKLAGWVVPEVFDTLALARRLMPDLERYRLGDLAAALGLAGGLSGGLVPHRATYDALVAARLFVRLAAAEAGSVEVLRGGRSEEEVQTLF